jgi:multidrug resistance efflux pump
MTACKDLESAQEDLDQKWRAYFDASAKLQNSQKLSPEEEEKLMEDALRAIDFGGTAAGLIPFDENADHTVFTYAPADGDILTIDAKAGSVVSTGAPVMTVNDRSRGLSLTVQIDEDSVGEMTVGDTADVTVGDDMQSCPITSIAASTEVQGMFDVSFSIPDNFGVVGQQASIKFRKRTQQYDVLIPLSALRQDNDGDFIYVVNQQEGSLGTQISVKRVDVYVLDQDNTRAALQAGITQRDLIVARSDRDIQDGDRVRLEEE